MTLRALYTAVRAEADRLLPGLAVRRVRGGVAVRGAWTLYVYDPRAVTFDAERMREWPDWRVGLRDLAIGTARAEVDRLEAECQEHEAAAVAARERLFSARRVVWAMEDATPAPAEGSP